MIYTDSRYADGFVSRVVDSRKNTYELALYRQFPEGRSNFFLYTWAQKDRIDLIANKFLGDPSLWWIIMDYNPEVVDPFDISVGTILRIPGV
jgi:hypothetical protein